METTGGGGGGGGGGGSAPSAFLIKPGTNVRKHFTTENYECLKNALKQWLYFFSYTNS